MKRFSKIFCIALIAIVFGGINQNWPFINTAFADAPHKKAVMALCNAVPNNDTGINPTISIKRFPDGATITDYDGTCYSNVANLLFELIKATIPSDDWEASKTILYSSVLYDDIDSQLTTMVGSQYPSYATVATFYLGLGKAIPDNANFSENDNVKAIRYWIDNKGAAATTTDVVPGVKPTYIDPSTYPSASTTDSNLCDYQYSLFHMGDWPKKFLQQVNCWIIAGISKVVSLGVQLMAFFIEPGSFGGISTNPAVVAGFTASIELVNIIFSVALVAMAIGTILNLKSYKINDLITKFIIVALLINFTLVIAGSILDLANYLSLFFLNLTAKSAGGGIVTAWTGIFSGVTGRMDKEINSIGILFITLFINLLVLIALIWAFGSIVFSLIKRGFMLIILLILSPFAVVASLLPGKGVEQWKKWKDTFLKHTFYGVYVTAGLYLGTVMLLSLCGYFKKTPLSSLATNTEMGFMSGLMVPIMAAGFLIYIVLLADELAGGSAKAAAEGISKLALGLAAGGLAAGATGIATKIGTSKTVGDLAKNLSSKGGLSAALGTRLSSFNKTSQGKAQESRKAVEAKLANENPEAYKDKVDNLLQRVGKGETLNNRDNQFLSAALQTLPDKQRKALSDDAQKAIPGFTDSMFKAGMLSKPEQKDINGTVPVQAAVFKSQADYKKAVKSLETEKDPKKIEQLEKDRQTAIIDNAGDIVKTVRYYRADNKDRKDDFARSIAGVNECLTSNSSDEQVIGLKKAIYEGLIANNSVDGLCNMLDEIQRSGDFGGQNEGERVKFFDNIVEKLSSDYNSKNHKQKSFVESVMRRMSKTEKASSVYEALQDRGIPVVNNQSGHSDIDDEYNFIDDTKK